MFELLTLNLSSPMSYGVSDISFDEVISSIYEKEDGFDSLFLYSISYSDDAASIKREKSAIGHLLKGAEESNELLTLTPGQYLFKQMMIPSSEKDLNRDILPFLYKSPSTSLYIRVLKESKLEAVMQILLPM